MTWSIFPELDKAESLAGILHDTFTFYITVLSY